jgi:Lanthionine synthetase C-like protein
VRMSAAVDVRSMALGGLEWILGQAQERGDGVAWSANPTEREDDSCLYSGAAGVVLTLLDAHRDLGDDRYADTAARAATTLGHAVESLDDSSLFVGLTGIAVALRAVQVTLGIDQAGVDAELSLVRVRSLFDGRRWAPEFELLQGNAGIALGALAAGDPELALMAVEPYVASAEATAHGVQWEVRLETESRLHHISHGTLGIALALAVVGHDAGRPDLVELALAGAADVVSRNSAEQDGFLVPHSDPQFMPELVERYSYGWCHGPTGDAFVFGALREITGDPAWSDLADRCWRTVTHSGLPQRLRAGFWDNSGRCCGTAGVLALACERYDAGIDQDLDFAHALVEDLAARASVDRAGVRWS